jgi:hypothetical protein
MTVTEQAVHDDDGRVEGGPPDDDGWPPKPRRSSRTTSVSPGVQLGMVAGVALVGFVVWWFAGLRHDVEVLNDKVDAIADQGGFVLPGDETEDTVIEEAEITTLPPEQAPPDAETARRKINDAVTAVFTPASPAEARSPAIDDPGDRAQRLAEASSRPSCADATLRVGGNRFVDHDHATSNIHFEVPQVQVANGYPFEVEVVRVGDEWKVTAASVDEVLGMASGICR